MIPPTATDVDDEIASAQSRSDGGSPSALRVSRQTPVPVRGGQPAQIHVTHVGRRAPWP